jgi:hypothetical protein
MSSATKVFSTAAADQVSGDSSDTVEPLARYRRWVNTHQAGAAILAGAVATHIATVFGYYETGVDLPRQDWMTAIGQFMLPDAQPNVQFLTGGIFHYADGIVFSVIFAFTLHPLLPWKSSPVGNALKGVSLGLILSTIVCIYNIPRVLFVHDHVGFFSHNLGWKTIFGIYLWHLVYGLHLGLIYNPSNADRPVRGGGVWPSKRAIRS